MALSGALDNRKTGVLARSLSIERCFALGLMEAFWGWARTAAFTGKVVASQWDDFSERIGWTRTTSDGLRELLIGAGFVDPMDGWDWIHDWDQHADKHTREKLEYSGLKFANGSPPRKYVKGSKSKVAEKQETVAEKQESVTPSARAQPEPEPEPEPAAAARVSNGSVAANAAAPPPPAGAIAQLLRMAMPFGTPPPDGDIIRRVQAAMQGASLAELSAAVVQYRKRGKSPNSYGFWPMYVQGALAPERRSELGALVVLEEPTPPPKSPSCTLCQGSGVVGRQPEKLDGIAVRAAIKAGGRLCDCDQGHFWGAMMDFPDGSELDGLPVIQRGALAVGT